MPYKVTQETAGAKMNVLLYGSPGAGKTYLAATAQDHPKMKDVLFVNVEGGMLTIANRGDIMAEDIRSAAGLETLIYNILNKTPGYETTKTVVIDSITELQTFNLEGLVKDAIDNPKGGKKRSSLDDVYLEDYGKSTKQLQRLLRMCRDLKVNVIMTALPKEVMPPGDNKGSKPIEVRPSLTNKLGNSVMGYVDFAWYIFSKNEEEGEGDKKKTVTNRYLLTKDFDVYRAKTRGNLDTFIKNPTMPMLYDLLIKV